MVSDILQAAATMFAELGYAAATTNKIALRAGVSIGSLYQYFPNKDSLLLALFDEHHREVERILKPALQRLADPQLPLADGIRHLLHELVAIHHANPDLTRALSSNAMAQSTAYQQMHRGEDQIQQVVAILAHRPDVRPGNYWAMALVMEQVMQHLSRWLVHDAPAQLGTDALSEELVLLLARYLATEQATLPAANPLEAVVAQKRCENEHG